MAKGRFLSKSVSTSQKLANLKSDSSRLLWTWLLPHLDREGRIHADPSIVKGRAVPRLKNHTDKTVEGHLRELAEVGLILLYEVNGDLYLQFSQFDENQPGLRKDREAESQCPPPPEEVRSKSGVIPELGGGLGKQALRLKLKDELRIFFDLKTRSWSNITAEDMEAWAQAYPACDLKTEFAKMVEWLIANPAKAVKSNWRRFIVNWLSKSQDRGGGMMSNAPRKPPVDMRVGEQKEKEHDAAYWTEVRRLKATGLEGEALSAAMAAWEREMRGKVGRGA